MYFYMPLNPYSRFLKQMSKRQLLIGRGVYYFVLFSQLLLITLYFLYILESLMDGKDGDFLRSSASYVWLILAMNSYFITWNIFASGPKVAELIAVLCESFPKTKEERNDLEVEPFTNKFLNMMAALKFVFGGTVVVMTLSQILRSVLILLWTGQWKPEMPLSIWLPFDPKMIAAYPFAYVGECWLFLCNCCILVAFEATMGGVILLICLQFRKVQFRFRTLNFGDYKTDLKGMIEVINLHNRTLDLAEKARQTFSISLFIIFLFSAMVICVFTFLMFTEKDPIINFQYFVNLACFLVYVVLYAYYGDQLFDYVSTREMKCWAG